MENKEYTTLTVAIEKIERLEHELAASRQHNLEANRHVTRLECELAEARATIAYAQAEFDKAIPGMDKGAPFEAIVRKVVRYISNASFDLAGNEIVIRELEIERDYQRDQALHFHNRMLILKLALEWILQEAEFCRPDDAGPATTRIADRARRALGNSIGDAIARQHTALDHDGIAYENGAPK